MNPQLIHETQAEALFASDLQPSDLLSAAAVRAAIECTIWAHGCRGCAAMVAQEFGEHPETAVTRMRWARRALDRVSRHPPAVAA